MMTHSHLLTHAFVALGLSLTLARRAHGTQPLEEFITRAATHGFDARESSAVSDEREAEADASLGVLLPSFTARGIYTRNQYEVAPTLPVDAAGNTRRFVIQKHNQLDGILELHVPLVDVANYHRYGAQKALARASREQQGAVELELARSVGLAYFQFIGASALVRSADLSVKASIENQNNVARLLNAGMATNLDTERANANVERARQDVADASLAVDLAAQQLETLTGLRPTPSADFPADDLHEEASLQSFQSEASKSAPAQAARKLEQAASAEEHAAASAWFPTLSGSAQEHFTNAPAFTDHRAFYTLQLVATLHLDYAQFARRRAQAAAHAQRGIQRERTERALFDKTFAAYRRVQTNIAKSRAARVEAAAAARAASMAVQLYAAGSATQLDVTQTQREAFLADARRIQADADLGYARAALRLSAGRMPGNVRRP
jgi:outer membrane protein TolC